MVTKRKVTKKKVVREARCITTTQPNQWVEAWKLHMKRTSRTNLSAFVAEAVNKLIENECKQCRFNSAVKGERGLRGVKQN